MANDSTSSGTSTQGIDLEDIEVEVLVIAQNPNLLQTTVSFLERRNWPTAIMHNLAQAVEHIVRNTPDVVLISINHPNPVCFKLPEILGRMFGIICVGFAEGLDTNSLHKLNNSKINHKLTVHPSGPNVHRAVLKAIMEKLKVTPDGKVIEPGMKSTESEEVLSTGKYTMAKTQRRSFKILSGNKRPTGPGHVIVGGSKGVDSSEKKGLEVPAADDLMGMLKKSLFGENAPAESLAPAPAPPAPVTPASILESAVTKAVAGICWPTGNLSRPLPVLSRVGVFPVDSKIMPGYLVVAIEPKEPAGHLDFLKACEIALQSACADMNVPGQLEAGFTINIPNVQFEEWAGTSATFMVKLEHSDSEVGIAFFSTAAPIPKARATKDKDIVAIDVKDIGTNQPVNFKAYLHMKKSEKYYLYLRNGRVLQPEQKQRLLDREVKDLHMKSVDHENLRMFLAASFLRGTIKRSA